MTKQVNKEVIKSISFYPDSWATKLRITLKEVEVKNEIIIEGLELFGKHVDFEDEGGALDRIVVTDAHPEWDLDVLRSVFSEYGDIVRCEREFYYEDGQKTIIETGKIFVYAGSIRTPIPRKLSVMVENKFHQINVWYKRQNEVHTSTNVRCAFCGLEHDAKDCTHQQMVCYVCQESGHGSRGCPNNKGCRKDEHSFIFYNGKSPLSNWNTEYPFRIGHQEYTCVEQYVMEEKAYQFGDSASAERIRNETNPREMKNIGRKIKRYNHEEWQNMVEAVTYKALEAKFNDPRAAGARDTLLETGQRRIGEANTDPYWGTGVDYRDPHALTHWTGSNAMGNMLVEIRDEIVKRHNAQARPLTEEASRLEEEGNVESQNGDESSVEEISDDESTIGANSSLDVSHLSQNNESFMSLPTPCQRQGSAATASTPKRRKIKAQTKTTEAKPKWVVALGDSNLPSLIENPCDSIPAKILCNKKSGLKLQDTPNLARKCLVPKDEVTQVVVHLGTTAWSYKAEVSAADEVYDEYEKMLNEVSSIYPHAKLVLSGVLPRDTTGKFAEKARLINEEIGKLNTKLKELEEKHDNVTFIPNDDIKTKEQGGNHFVEDTVHLSPEGAEILLKNVRNGIREVLLSSGSTTSEWSTGK